MKLKTENIKTNLFQIILYIGVVVLIAVVIYQRLRIKNIRG
jgi:hypothetical protein